MDSGSEPTRKLQLAPPEDAASSRRELEERVSKLKAGESADSTVLLLSEQPEDQRTLEKVLEDWRLRIVRCSSFREALQVLSLCPVLLAFCDVRNANSTFDELLQLIRLERPTRIVAMVPEDIGESAYRAVMRMFFQSKTLPQCHDWNYFSTQIDHSVDEIRRIRDTR